MLHGYCVRLKGDPGPDSLPGVDGKTVELLERGRLGIWFSEGAEGGVSAQRLREHELVVRAALRSATPLPLRYGALVSGTRELEQLLEAKEEEFVTAIRRFADRVEMGVRVSPADVTTIPRAEVSEPSVQGSGRAYLEARRRAHERSAGTREMIERLLDEVEAELAGLDAESVREVDVEHGISGSMAHLLHRQLVPLYRTTLQGMQQRRPDLRITVSGPWAPYSFV